MHPRPVLELGIGTADDLDDVMECGNLFVMKTNVISVLTDDCSNY